MSERDQPNRWRCTAAGCNPVMKSVAARDQHVTETGHRTAKWPIRSAEGKRRARQRNRSGYYSKYNVGAKSYSARLGGRDIPGGDTAFGEEEAMGL